MVQYKEFRVGDLFEQCSLSFNKCGKFDKKSDISKERSAIYSLPLVNAKHGDNGIMYYGKPEYFESEIMTIGIVNDGAVSTGDVYPHPEETGVLYNAYLIKLKHYKPNAEILMYLACVLQKAIKYKYGYSNKGIWSKVQNDVIILPVTDSGAPDFDYMTEYITELEAERITELEAERITELEAYLVVAGLNDYELTDEDKKVLSLSPVRAFDEAGCAAPSAVARKKVKEFKISDLFEKLEVPYNGIGARHSDISDVRTDEYSVPVTTAKKGDNGICRWAKPGQFKTYNNVISVVYNGAIAAGLTYYQPDEVSSLTDSYLIRLRDGELNEQSGLFLASAIQKVAKTKFSRENKAVWTRVGAENIVLPITDDGLPDYNYMTAYIRAQEKLAIADAVKLKDRIIAETKAIVS